MATRIKKGGNVKGKKRVESVTVPIVYEGLDAAPVLFANQLTAQYAGGEFVLTIGQTVAPPILGETLEERREQAMKMTHITCRVLMRIGLTPDRMREFAKVLSDNLDSYESILKQGQQS